MENELKSLQSKVTIELHEDELLGKGLAELGDQCTTKTAEGETCSCRLPREAGGGQLIRMDGSKHMRTIQHTDHTLIILLDTRVSKMTSLYQRLG